MHSLLLKILAFLANQITQRVARMTQDQSKQPESREIHEIYKNVGKVRLNESNSPSQQISFLHPSILLDIFSIKM